MQILSEYATFETMNGNVVTIRLANHNAHVSGFDHNGKDNGISPSKPYKSEMALRDAVTVCVRMAWR